MTSAGDGAGSGGQGDSGEGGASGDDASGGTSGESGAGSTAGDTGGSSAGAGGSGSGSGGSGAGGSGAGGMGSAEPEMLDPDTDWEAYDLIYESSFSAYDGVHTYQVPVYVMDTEFELADWQAIPSSAVSFEEDPESGGVLVTILEPVEDITIAVSSGGLGGTAPLHVTIGTEAEWEMGKARYNNGVEYTIMFDLAALLDPNFMPPEPPGDLACNNCHTTGAKYFEVQHTPTQAAHYSDDELITIFTDGMKPEGVGYRILPEMFQYLYAEFHTWESDPAEQKGMIMYMRSLTPTGQGDIKLPDGSYVPVGTMPPAMMP